MSAAPIRLTVWIEGEHYRPLLELARQKGYEDVSQLLGRAAPTLLEKPAPTRKVYVRVTPDMRARMVELRHRGATMAEIARALGVSEASVWNHLNAAETINAEATR